MPPRVLSHALGKEPVSQAKRTTRSTPLGLVTEYQPPSGVMETPVLPSSGVQGDGNVIQQPASALSKDKKRKKKRALKEIEVTEGVDMFKELIPEDTKKHKSEHTLRAMPKKAVVVNMQETKGERKRSKGKAEGKKKRTHSNGGGAPAPRGRPPKGQYRSL